MAEILKEIKEKTNTGDVQVDISGVEIGLFTPEVKEYLQSCKKMEVLVLSDCGLTSLENFPLIKTLQAIDLSNNKLSDDGKIQELLNCQELTQIFFNNNQIKSLNTIMKLKSLPKLIEIDCEGNEVAENNNYSKKVFEEFSVIEIVDKKDKDGNDIVEEEEQEYAEDDDDDDEDQYEEEEDEEQFDEDDYEEESDEPKKSRKKTKKN